MLALGAYYILLEIALRLKDVSFGDYAADAMTFELSSVPKGIATAYLTFVRFFTWRTRGLIPTRLSAIAHFLLFVAGGVLLPLRLWRQKITDPVRLVLLLVLVALLPLSINCMFVVTPAWSVHTLVLYSFAALYLFAVIVADSLMPEAIPGKLPELLRRSGLNLTAASLALILLGNIYTANAAYLQMHLRYENTYAFYTSLLADMRTVPGFDEDTTLAVIGSYDDPDFYNYYLGFLNELMGVNGFPPDTYTKGQFLEYYLGVTIPVASEAEIEQISQTPEYQAMAVYPYYGSIKMIGDYLVVKLS